MPTMITHNTIKASFIKAMAAAQPATWLSQITNMFTSDSAYEEYPWGNATDGFREWIAGRHAKGFTENHLTIKNKTFEDSVVVLKKDMRRDKLGAIQSWINDLAVRAAGHPEELVSDLIDNGATLDSYDGKKYFATDHEWKDSGAQSNLISIDISELPVVNHGVTTSPSVTELQWAIAQGVAQIIGFKDSAGKPRNRNANQFLAMVPHTFMFAAMQAMSTPGQLAESQTVLSEFKRKFGIDLEVNPNLTWTDSLAVFRKDSFIKPLVFQRETDIHYSHLIDGSDYTYNNNAYQYGLDYSGNAALGLWEGACKITLT